jgi:alkaline phosphatase
LLTAAACGSGALDSNSSSVASPLAPSSTLNLVRASSPPVLVGAGDIAMCSTVGSEATAKLLDGIDGTVFTVGDNAYMNGTANEFKVCYDPTWGRHKARTRPTPGNHEMLTAGGEPYFDYFGANAGPYGVGYYSYTVGSWLVLALNSEDLSDGSGQLQFVKSELAKTNARCTVAYWHRPLFSSGPNGRNPDVQGLWRILYDAGVDVVLNGHDHLYERFAPQDPNGRRDPERGIRQFTIGTGGASLYTIGGAALPTSEAAASGWGVLKLSLFDDSYRWEFIPTDGGGFQDSGLGQCH